MKRALIIGLATVVFIGVLIFKSREAQPRSPISGRAMGTTWTLAWRGDAPLGIRHEVATVLEHWEQVMSQWRGDSALSRFNRGEPASADLTKVIRLAETMREASGGAFDHRILEHVHAAGYGPAGKGIDLSAIGKGYAVDRVGERLRQIGMRDFIFELGGEVLASGDDWPVDIESPVSNKPEPARTLTLRDRALATSGNYHQSGHLIDPRSGQPVKRPPCSVSVLAADCASADAWATALFVLGPEYREIPTSIEVKWQFE
jgi:thiamine biosynthesis lipoprotein